MAKKRLILHVGMHKTGTTSVQRFFSRNRMMLRRMGVLYPTSIGPDGKRQPKHNAIFTAISHEADFGATHPVLGPSSAVISGVADQIDDSPCELGVISAEGLSGERPVFAEAMAPLADRFDVTVIIFLRRQDHWIESFYKQMVLSREVREEREFHTFLAAQSTQAHLRYDKIVGWWDERFGRENVRLSGFHPNGPVSPLIRLMDISGMNRRLRWLPFARSRENRSAGIEAVEVVRRYNQKGLDAPRNAADLIEAQMGAGTQRYLTEEERAELLDIYLKGNQSLTHRLPEREKASLCPNKAEIGRSNERLWKSELPTGFWSKSKAIISLNN